MMQDGRYWPNESLSTQSSHYYYLRCHCQEYRLPRLPGGGLGSRRLSENRPLYLKTILMLDRGIGPSSRQRRRSSGGECSIEHIVVRTALVGAGPDVLQQSTGDMHLLRVADLTFEEIPPHGPFPKYAILSHTWISPSSEEVTFQNAAPWPHSGPNSGSYPRYHNQDRLEEGRIYNRGSKETIT